MVRDPESGAGADRAMSNRTPAGFTHAAPVRRHIEFLMGEILFGLCIPNQGTAKSMAR